MDKRSRRGASASQPDNDGNDPCDTTAAAVEAALAEQKRTFETLLDVQLIVESNYELMTREPQQICKKAFYDIFLL